jgi:O-antigen/teichoic acid export membrane protein
MLPLGYDKLFNRLITLSALLHIILLLVLVPKYFAVGTSVAVVITEFVVTLLTYLFVQKKKILFSNNEI